MRRRACIFPLILLPFAMICAEEFHSKNNFFEGKTKIEDPMSLRDPFKAEAEVRSIQTQTQMTFINKDGVYTNIDIPEESGQNEKPSNLSLDTLSSMELTGILMGQERRAIAKMKNKKNTFIIKEGMKIGEDNANAVVKAILPGGIVVLEKFVNVYGEEEFVETIIPLTPAVKTTGTPPANSLPPNYLPPGQNNFLPPTQQ